MLGEDGRKIPRSGDPSAGSELVLESSILFECMRKLGKPNVVGTDIYPVECLLPDVRLIPIWTRKNEIMAPVILVFAYEIALVNR